jgi:hypothetical protein
VTTSLNNNDLENFFSLVAQSLGYKPKLPDFEAKAQLLDYQQRQEYDPDREYQIIQSKRKRYDLATFSLETALGEFNDGAAIDPRSGCRQGYILDVVKRAIAAAKGKYEGIHAIQKKAATGDRH